MEVYGQPSELLVEYIHLIPMTQERVSYLPHDFHSYELQRREGP